MGSEMCIRDSRQLDHLADAARRDRHRAAPRRELQGVGEKVRRDLTDPIGVDEREEFVITQVPVQRDLLGLGQGHHALDDHSRDGGQVNGLSLQGHLAGENARQVEEVVDQPVLGVRVPFDAFELSLIHI